MFEPSKYQKGVFEFIENSSGHAMVNAVAGSGKTTTLLHASKLLPNNVHALFLAFNKAIAEHLSSKLRGSNMQARTNHSLGFSVLSQHLPRVFVDEKKYKVIIKKLLGPGANKEVLLWLEKYFQLSRVTLTDVRDESALAEVKAHYGLLTPELDLGEQIVENKVNLPEMLLKIQERGKEIAFKEGLVDFTDMLWLPIACDMYFGIYDVLFVDEAQDLSKLQLAMIRRSIDDNSRILGVGDPRQAIFGFAGSNCDSFDEMANVLSATTLPLSICYRCPKSHLKLAQELVPEIEPADSAEDGLVEEIPEVQLPTKLQAHDLVLCRLTAPLVQLCIQLITQKIPAKVKGRDVGAQLVTLARRVADDDPDYDYDEFPAFLAKYASRRIEFLAKKDDQSGIELLQDQVQALGSVWTHFACSTFGGFCDAINALFSDDDALITLSTVHRAKGLEADRVFLLRPEKLPLVWKKQLPWQYRQELNLKYVALTRSKKELYFVRSNGQH